MAHDLADCLCPICTDVPTIPVSLEILQCGCKYKQRYCLTCVRDSLNLNGFKNGAGEVSLNSCPTCRESFTIEPTVFRYDGYRQQNGINWSKVYNVDNDLIPYLDEKFGDSYCPRDCEWTGKRANLRKHLSECPNTFRFKCDGCHKMFNKPGLVDHLNDSSELNYCKDHYASCQWCPMIFAEDGDLDKHINDCPGLEECCACHEKIYFEDFQKHFVECGEKEIEKLRQQLEKL